MDPSAQACREVASTPTVTVALGHGAPQPGTQSAADPFGVWQLPESVTAVEQRYCFVAWPQTYAHGSWFDALDSVVGIAVSRETGPMAGMVEHQVAQCLVAAAGGHYAQPVAGEHLPWWVLQSPADLRRHLSAVGALLVLPELSRAVGGAEARHWDGVLGNEVRRAALRHTRAAARFGSATELDVLRQQAREATRLESTWSKFVFRLGLAALLPLGQGVGARYRLQWPHDWRELQPLQMTSGSLDWLIQACMTGFRLQGAHGPTLEGQA